MWIRKTVSERTTSKIPTGSPTGSPKPGQYQVLSILFFLYALQHWYMVADIYLSFVWCSRAFSPSPSLNCGVVTKGNRIQHCCTCTCTGNLISRTTVWLMEKGGSHTQSGYPDKGMLSTPGRSAVVGDFSSYSKTVQAKTCKLLGDSSIDIFRLWLNPRWPKP